MILKNGKRIDGCSDTVPIGTLNPYVGSTAPYGYLLCQGQLVSKTTYKELYEICGNTFGTATATEFYLPDLRGRTIVGYKEGDTNFGTLGGLVGSVTSTTGNHTLTAAESGLPKHNHRLNLGADVGWTTIPKTASASTTNGTDAIYDAGGTAAVSAHNHGDVSTIQPSINLNWIVKAFMLMPNQSYVANATQESSVNTYSCDYINDKIDNLEDNKQNTLTTQTVSVTSNFNVIVYRYGNVVSVDIDGNVEASANEIIATGLPKAPYAWTYLPDVSGSLLFRVDSNGNLYARNNLSNWVNLHGVYISTN